MMPRWIFPPIPATGQFGGLNRIKCDESRKMIGFEVILGLLGRRRRRGKETGNRIRPELFPLQQGAGATA
jgi:hypothetical protein